MSSLARPAIHTLRFDKPNALSEFNYVLDSMLVVETGELTINCRGRMHVAPAGHLILLAAGERVDLRGVPGFTGFRLDSVQIQDSVMDWFERQHRTLLRNLVDHDKSERIVFPRSADTTRLWEQMAAAIREEQAVPMIEHGMHGVLLQLVLEGWTLPFLFRNELPLRRQVERLIMHDVAHDWNACEVAAAMGVSEPTLRRRLSAEGTSYRMLLEDARMNQALEMLMSTSMPIGHIAQAVGYLSASRFSMRFASRYGISPRMLRNVRSDSALKL